MIFRETAALIFLISYLLTGVYQIIRDFREPFHNRPAYARGHSFFIGALMNLLGWLPIGVIKAVRFKLWKETIVNFSIFIALVIFGQMLV